VEEAKKLAQGKEDKEIARKEKELARVAEIKALAVATGEKQALYRETVECNDRYLECSTDIITRWIMPDGTITTTRTHTY
jgi:hypothetical protein